MLTGICVGAGTIAFFLLFQKRGPLSSVPAILARGAAILGIAGIVFFKEPLSVVRLLGIAPSLAGLFLLRGLERTGSSYWRPGVLMLDNRLMSSAPLTELARSFVGPLPQ